MLFCMLFCFMRSDAYSLFSSPKEMCVFCVFSSTGKNAAPFTFLLELERTETDCTVVNHAFENHITYYPYVFEHRKRASSALGATPLDFLGRKKYIKGNYVPLLFIYKTVNIANRQQSFKKFYKDRTIEFVIHRYTYISNPRLIIEELPESSWGQSIEIYSIHSKFLLVHISLHQGRFTLGDFIFICNINIKRNICAVTFKGKWCHVINFIQCFESKGTCIWIS